MELLGPLIIVTGVALVFLAIACWGASRLLYVLKVRSRPLAAATALVALTGLFAVSAYWWEKPFKAPSAEAPPRSPWSGADAAAPSVTASRIFSGPDQYPPRQFAAYGILAFRSRADSSDRPRHQMLCEAYVAGLPHASELDLPPEEQMVTVWPADSDGNADRLNRMLRNAQLCEIAIDHYGLTTALQALKDAELAGAEVSDIGPYLLAWSPADDKGRPDALVLISDLSHVTTAPQAQRLFIQWARDIEADPRLWQKGWDLEKVRLTIRLWVDEVGPSILTLSGGKS